LCRLSAHTRARDNEEQTRCQPMERLQCFARLHSLIPFN
jgi:hypothetical protein